VSNEGEGSARLPRASEGAGRDDRRDACAASLLSHRCGRACRAHQWASASSRGDHRAAPAACMTLPAPRGPSLFDAPLQPPTRNWTCPIHSPQRPRGMRIFRPPIRPGPHAEPAGLTATQRASPQRALRDTERRRPKDRESRESCQSERETHAEEDEAAENTCQGKCPHGDFASICFSLWNGSTRGLGSVKSIPTMP